MKTHPSRRALPAFTLVEMTVVISVMLSLVSVFTASARAWKRGSDRSDCIMGMRNIQMAVRSYQNLYGYDPGTYHSTDTGTPDIILNIYQRDLITRNQCEMAFGRVKCDGGGTYSRGEANRFPLTGASYVTCSLSVTEENHAPDAIADW